MGGGELSLVELIPHLGSEIDWLLPLAGHKSHAPLGIALDVMFQ